MSAASLATLDGSLRMTPVEQPRPPVLADLGSRLMIVVERREDWASYLPSEEVLTAQEYLEQSARDHGGRRVQVINLCRGYKYLGLGYYCSLLAEARGHRVIPSLRCISELARKSVYGLALGGLDKALDKALCRTPYGATDGFTLTLYFAIPSSSHWPTSRASCSKPFPARSCWWSSVASRAGISRACALAC